MQMKSNIYLCVSSAFWLFSTENMNKAHSLGIL